ncbi:MAG: sodium/proline symporter [Hyphomonadaceae bacterium]|nr:sodium/proline symporter [Hyphomonadaceae bacterium]
MTENLTIIIVLVGYKVLLLGVGFWASQRVKNEADFFIGGGRGLGAWTAGLSYAASTSSAWVLLGFTGILFSRGLIALWLLPGIFGGYVLTWIVMGPRLNDETRHRGHVTIVDFMATDASARMKRMIGLTAAAMILFCFVFYISSQFQAAGNAFSSVFHMESAEAILLGATIIVVYCLLGGFWAASITDAIQACIMGIGCILVPMVTLASAGGIGNVLSTLSANETAGFFSLTGESVGFVGVGLALGLLGTGLGALGQPQLLNRIMAVESRSARLRGAAITIGWGAIIYTGLVWLALSARAMEIEAGGESLFFVAAGQFLPPVLAGVVIAAVLSAVMSTVDSLLLAAASAISRDAGFRWKNPKRALLTGRVAMGAVAVFAVLMTLYLPRDIFSRVLFAWVALGAAFGPIILTRCLGWQVRSEFRLFAMLAGFLTAVAAYYIDGPVAEVVEKWVAWIVGLAILRFGRESETGKVQSRS